MDRFGFGFGIGLDLGLGSPCRKGDGVAPPALTLSLTLTLALSPYRLVRVNGVAPPAHIAAPLSAPHVLYRLGVRVRG